MDTAFINPQIFTIAGVAAVVIVAAVVMIVRHARKPRKFSRTAEVFLALLVLASGALAMGTVFTVQQGIMTTERLNSIEKNYGIKMDARHLSELRAPRAAPPAPKEGEFSTFGVTQVVHENKVLTLYLGWDGEKFDFYSQEGVVIPRLAG